MHCGVPKGPQETQRAGHATERLSLQRAQWELWRKLGLCLFALWLSGKGPRAKHPESLSKAPKFLPSPLEVGKAGLHPSSLVLPTPPCVGAELLSFEEAFQLGKLPEVYTSYSFLEEAEVQKTWVLGLALPLTSCVSRGQLLSTLALGLGFHIWGEIFSYHHIPLPGTPPRPET